MLGRLKKSWPLLVWIIAITVMAVFVLMKQNQSGEILPHMVGKNISSIDFINSHVSNISKHKKPIRLVLLSTRCETCEALAGEMAHDLTQPYTTVGIFYRANKSEIDLWVKKHHVKFDLIIPDLDGKSLVDMGAKFLPTTILADPDGTIIGVQEG